jgi:phage terminase small subunit
MAGNLLTARQRAFAEAYARRGVAERAAIEAGYEKKAARQQGSRLLTNRNVKNYLKELAAATQRDTIATLAELRELWTNIARATVRGKPPPWKDRLKATELLGKSIGAFVERLEVEMRPVTINLNLGGKRGT